MLFKIKQKCEDMRLKEYINKFEVTGAELARATKVSAMTISRIINGYVPSLEIAAKIEDATFGKVRMRDMLPNKEEENGN